MRAERESGVESNKIGLNNIKQIVEQYNGTVEVMKDEADFRIQIMLQVQKNL